MTSFQLSVSHIIRLCTKWHDENCTAIFKKLRATFYIAQNVLDYLTLFPRLLDFVFQTNTHPNLRHLNNSLTLTPSFPVQDWEKKAHLCERNRIGVSIIQQIR